MQRVETLCETLQEQLREGASIEQLLMTVQMIQSELLHLQSMSPESASQHQIAIHIPSAFEHILNPPPTNEESADREHIVLEFDMEEMDLELEEMRKNAETKNTISLKNRPAFPFDPVQDIPTLSQHIVHSQPVDAKPAEPVVAKPEPVSERSSEQKPSEPMPEKPVIRPSEQLTTTSLNDRLKEEKREISDTLQQAPIKDLRKAIGINDRYVFIQSLFKGDEVMFDRSIKTINDFAIYPEAAFWIKRELKLKLGWEDDSDVVHQFDQLVKRRFAAT
ncbi:MAG: hypothetical protein ACKO5C_00670 [Ferruginibacter sp.]